MRKTLITLSLFLIFGITALFPQSGFAQSPTPTSAPKASAAGDLISFSQLGMTDAFMRGPYDVLMVRFSTPIDWDVQGVEIRLVLDPQFSSLDGKPLSDKLQTGYGSLFLTFNGTANFNILLNWTGERTLVFTVPGYALKPIREDGRYELRLFLDAGIDCNLNHQTVLDVKSTSQFYLPHKQAAPILDLAKLPRPIYQPSSFAPNQALVIVPDEASAAEVRAALIVSAGFGRMTLGNLPIALVPASLATAEKLKDVHPIFVGKSQAFSILKQVTLPSSTDVAPDDGIIQMAPSPWNSAKAVLYVGGTSDAGIVKAAEAVSSGRVRVAGNPNQAVVSDVLADIKIPAVATDRTLADLGYKAEMLTGIGLQSVDYRFFVPSGQVTTADAYLDLIFSTSALLDYSRSGISVLVNDQMIGSARYSETTTRMTTARINIPPYVVHSGFNILTIQSNHLPADYCSEWSLNNLWTSLSDATLLHLPLIPAPENAQSMMNLGVYPLPFTADPTLSSFAFVLPARDPASWNVAAQLAADLGKRTYGALVNVEAVFGDAVPDAVRQAKDLLLVGRASQLPIVADLNGTLPAPFDAGSDQATERSFQVVYKLPKDSSIGYLELLPAPWQPNRTVLAVLGSTASGVNMAASALITPALRSQLGGDFAVVNGEQVLVADSRLKIGTGNLTATALPSVATPVPASTASAPAQAVVPEGQPTWILPAIGLSTGAIIVLLIVMGVFALFRRKS